jgi:hypothetical protein
MRELVFRLWILTLGLTLLCALIYGLVAFPPQTITQSMIDWPVFRLILTACVILQLTIWLLCVWSKRRAEPETADWAFVCITLVGINWIALSTILTDTSHIVFVAITVACLLIFLLLVTHMTSHPESVLVLHMSIFILVVSIVAMIILYNNHHFFIPEYIAFITYSLIFTAFFSIHTQVNWDEDVDDVSSELLWDNGTDPYCTDPYPKNSKRPGAVWLPQRV